ncbi:MBL fold metallo-hydrolase [Streptomyces echinoruber]|uniref:MBL fold metallo-hydrolase n=1 Tax=Streptomyces echinoruber TaxID=68898 RepID=A0A918VJG8_9ACTN|nr:MBL fold metallo-hydrolase [Streptomyces echinoruber]
MGGTAVNSRWSTPDRRGRGGAIADAVRRLGHAPAGVRRIVLTHFPEDHAGGAGEFAALSGAAVLAHRLDAPYVRGEAPGPPPVLQDGERPLLERARRLPHAESVRPRRVVEVGDGDVLGFGGGARVVHVPGHTEGSVALHLPCHGVLFTGDAVAAPPVDGTVLPGVFNLDRARMLASFRRLARLSVEVACFGHGDPVLAGAGEVLRGAAGGAVRP